MYLRAKGWLCLDLYVLSVRHNSVSSWHLKMVKMVNFMLCVFCLLRAQLLSPVKLFVTLWTIAYQAPLSMGFFLQEYWSGLSFLPPGPLPDPGIKPLSLELQAYSLLLSHWGNPCGFCHNIFFKRFFKAMISLKQLNSYLNWYKTTTKNAYRNLWWTWKLLMHLLDGC